MTTAHAIAPRCADNSRAQWIVRGGYHALDSWCSRVRLFRLPRGHRPAHLHPFGPVTAHRRPRRPRAGRQRTCGLKPATVHCSTPEKVRAGVGAGPDLNREVRRRADVVQVYPNRRSPNNRNRSSCREYTTPRDMTGACHRGSVGNRDPLRTPAGRGSCGSPFPHSGLLQQPAGARRGVGQLSDQVRQPPRGLLVQRASGVALHRGTHAPPVPVATHSRRSKTARASSHCWVWGFFRSGWRILKLWARARLSPPMMSG